MAKSVLVSAKNDGKVHIRPLHTGRTLCGYRKREIKKQVHGQLPDCENCLGSLHDLASLLTLPSVRRVVG